LSRCKWLGDFETSLSDIDANGGTGIGILGPHCIRDACCGFQDQASCPSLECSDGFEYRQLALYRLQSGIKMGGHCRLFEIHMVFSLDMSDRGTLGVA
jgi:hypothetical protein